MRTRHAKVARLATAITGGGLTLGALMAMAVPTQMKRHGDYTWAERAKDTYASIYAPEPAQGFMIEVPPQDLTPALWEAEPVQPPPALDYDPSDVDMDATEAILLDAADAAAPPGPDAPLVRVTRGSEPAGAADMDAAGATAEVALAAAADVRAAAAVSAAPDSEAGAPPAADPADGGLPAT